MKTMKQKEREILDRWKVYSATCEETESFAEDGLLYRGNIYFEKNCWHREEGNEEHLWVKALKRVAFLTKDLNDEEPWDIHEETGRYNHVAFQYEKAIPFYKNLRMWFYGIVNTTAEETIPYKMARNMEITGPYYEQAPVVHINCKKQCGKGTLDNAVLSTYLSRYAPYLQEQIKLYDANILICCGYANGINLILNFVRSQYLPDLISIPDTADWIYYSPSTGKIVINAYHPSHRIGYESIFTQMIDAYQQALQYIQRHSLMQVEQPCKTNA